MTVRWANFSEHLDSVLRKSRDLANQLNYHSITPELILLAIVQNKDCLASKVLENLGFTRALEIFMTKILVSSSSPIKLASSNLTSEAERVLALAQQLADSQGHSVVNTMHLLLSLLDPNNQFRDVLQFSHGISLDEIRLTEKRVLRDSPHLLDEGLSLNGYRELGVPSYVLPA